MIIELKDIYKSYQQESNERKVLSNLSLKIAQGDSLSIVGPSGCGKSTLLNLMGLLDLPTSGDIIFEGQNTSSSTDDELAVIRNKNIGFVFQQHQLLPQLNLLENVLLPTLANKKRSDNKLMNRAMELLNNVGLDDKIHQYPSQMSGGECQRTAVVRALINEPKLILADEPTGSLDNTAAEQLGDLLIKMNKDLNIALVVVTHSLNLAEKMDKKYKLENGSLTS